MRCSDSHTGSIAPKRGAFSIGACSMTLSNRTSGPIASTAMAPKSPVPQQNEPKNATIGECRGGVKCERKRCRRGRGIPSPGGDHRQREDQKWQSEPAWYRLVFNDQNGRPDNCASQRDERGEKPTHRWSQTRGRRQQIQAQHRNSAVNDLLPG